MRFALTGATGLLGANLAALLREAGHKVVCTHRATSRVDHLGHLDVTWAEATLADTDALTRAFDGADGVFHCAAAVTIRRSATPEMVAANVDGTRNVMAAVQSAGAGRLVHCSSVVAVGISDNGQPCDETQDWNMPAHGLDDGYATTKRQAELFVVEATRQGLDAVVINPGYIFGPMDVRPSSGQMILDVVRRTIPGYTRGRNNYVDARDVARGMLLAHEKGRVGERYILGGDNLLYKDAFERIATVAGTKPPSMAIPHPIARVSGLFGDIQQKLTGREPSLNSNTVVWAYVEGFQFSSDKARTELGYTTGPLEDAIASALSWFRSQNTVGPLPNFP